METEMKPSLEERLKGIKAQDIMSRFAVTVKEEESLLDVAYLMMKLRISGSPVVSAVGKLVGMITVTDLFKVMQGGIGQAQGSSQSFSENTKVRDVMTRDVTTIGKETSLYDIITMMQTRNIHTLPVVESEIIAGIVGRRDVIYAYYTLFMEVDLEGK